MRSIQFLALALLLVACGNYSNDDIEFYDALPDQQALQVNVPQKSSALIGQPAFLYSGAVQSGMTIDDALENIIGLIDLIRQLAPSARTADSRTWGPFPDKTPGFEDQVVIQRSGTDFTYEFDQRNTTNNGSFVGIITGDFNGATARSGHGSLNFDSSKLVSIGHVQGDPNLLTIQFVYANDQTPRTVTTTITAKDATSGQSTSVTYDFNESSAEGDLDFNLIGPTADAGPWDLRVHARWLGDGGAGQGYAVGSVAAITWLEFDVGECWSNTFDETYFSSATDIKWDGGHWDLPGLGCDGGTGTCEYGTSSACPFGAPGP